EQIAHFGVSRIAASPAFFEKLIEHGRAAGRSLLNLRKLHTGGAPVFPRVLDGLRRLAPNAAIEAVYGSTEAEPIAHIAVEAISPNDRETMQRGGGLPAGAPVPEIKLCVVRDRWGTPRGKIGGEEFAREILPAGDAGEIVVAGDHVLPGYL